MGVHDCEMGISVYCNVTVGVSVMAVSVGIGVFCDVITIVADGPGVSLAVGVGEICVESYVGSGVSLIVGEAMGVNCVTGISVNCSVTVGVAEPVGEGISVMVGVNVGCGVSGANVSNTGIVRVGMGVHVSVMGVAVGKGVAVRDGSNCGQVGILS